MRHWANTLSNDPFFQRGQSRKLHAHTCCVDHGGFLPTLMVMDRVPYIWSQHVRKAVDKQCNSVVEWGVLLLLQMECGQSLLRRSFFNHTKLFVQGVQLLHHLLGAKVNWLCNL